MSERLPFREVRSELPLTDDDFAAIRVSVMARIHAGSTKHSRTWRIRYAAVAATAAFCAVATLFVIFHRPANDYDPAIRRSPVSTPASTAAPTPISRVPGIRAVTVTAPPQIASVAPIATHHRRAVARRPAEARPVSTLQPHIVTAGAAQLTIQLQTSNPDVRIIWIVAEGETR